MPVARGSGEPAKTSCHCFGACGPELQQIFVHGRWVIDDLRKDLGTVFIPNAPNGLLER